MLKNQLPETIVANDTTYNLVSIEDDKQITLRYVDENQNFYKESFGESYQDAVDQMKRNLEEK